MMLKVPIEVPIVILCFGGILSDSLLKNLVVYRSCITLQYNETECFLLGRSGNEDPVLQELEKTVQPFATHITMVKSLVDGIVGSTICLFAASWSDKFGRRPLIIASNFGFLMSSLSLIIFSIFDGSPWFILTCSLPTLLLGGGNAFITSILAYITDITKKENIGLRLGLFEALISAAAFAASITSSYLFYSTNYTVVFSITAVIQGSCFVYFWTFLDESLDSAQKGSLRNVFAISHLKSTLSTTFKPREENRRRVLIIILLSSILMNLANSGDSSVFFFYLREKYSWSLQDYNFFSSINLAIAIVGSFIGIIILHKILRIPELVLLPCGFVSNLNSSLVLALGGKSWQVYFASSMKCLEPVIRPMFRSFSSKLVDTKEIGEVFSLVVISESIIGMLGSPIYTEVYNATISTNPACYNFISAGLHCTVIGLLIWMIVDCRKCHYESLECDSDCDNIPSSS